ncbi:MAG TPA: alpha/beta hydrolase [Dongiaceae bacterium]|nr:alpha/beta hydrolase [Dongiaceae bacterium]
MKQILVIHGGTTFPTYEAFLDNLKNSPVNYDQLLAYTDWKGTLKRHFPNDDIITPRMPNSQNAQYSEWAIVFEKVLPFLHESAVLIGHSMGAIFLAKYLHEHPLKQPVEKLILVAAPYDDETGESLGNFKLTSAKGLEKSAEEVHFFFSEDDPIVPITERDKFMGDVPTAYYHTLPDRKHFWQEEFPEIVDLMKQ